MAQIALFDTDDADDSVVSVQDFIRNGHMMFAFSPRPGLVESVVGGFLSWLRAYPDPTERKLWSVQMPHTDPKEGPDDGFLPRKDEDADKRPQGGVYDSKDLWHFRPYLPHVLRARGLNVDPWMDWFSSCHELWRYSRGRILALGKHLDRELPGHFFYKNMTSELADLNHVIRIIRYDPPRYSGQLLGKTHADRNSVTIQIAENRPGLYLHGPQGVQLYRQESDRRLFFAGRLLGEHLNHLIPMLRHSISVPPDAILDGEERWAVIFFAHVFGMWKP